MKNILCKSLIVIFSIIFLMVSSTYQQYVDPLFFLLIFCYFNFVDEIKICTTKYISAYFVFYVLMLSGALFYRNICTLYFLKAACEV